MKYGLSTIVIDEKILNKYSKEQKCFDIFNYYLLREKKSKRKIEKPRNLLGVIEYDKIDIKQDAYNVFKNIIIRANVENIEQILIVTDNKSLLDLAKVLCIPTDCSENPVIKEQGEGKMIVYKKNVR